MSNSYPVVNAFSTGGVVPPGGPAGTVLRKLSDTDYDVTWESVVSDVIHITNVTGDVVADFNNSAQAPYTIRGDAIYFAVYGDSFYALTLRSGLWGGATGNAAQTTHFKLIADFSNLGAGAPTINKLAAAQQITVNARNSTGAVIPAHTVLHVDYSASPPNIFPANNATPASMPAGAVATSDIATGTIADMAVQGFLTDVRGTAGMSSGDVLFVGLNGGITNVKPAAPATAQVVGMVLRPESAPGAKDGTIWMDFTHEMYSFDAGTY